MEILRRAAMTPALSSLLQALPVLLCALFDDVPAVVDKRHVYLPTTWLAKEYPDMAEVFRSIERRVTRESNSGCQ
jgi:hypothetical protein